VSTQERKATEALFEPGGVVELRAIKNGYVSAGYYSDHEALSKQAGDLDEQGYTSYVTLNPVRPALLARAENKVKRSLRETTSDKDVLRRRWLLVDADPNLPSGISSTDAEKEAALQLAREVYSYLREQGWPEPIAGDSGNGAHLLYAVDLPNDADSLQLVKRVLEALSFKFSDERVKIDTSVCNASRISKLYGTTARKGDSTEARPHRPSRLLKVPDERVEASRGQLEAVAALVPDQPRTKRGNVAFRHEFDLQSWVREYGVAVRREGPWQGGYRWVLEECPWNGHTDNAAYIVRHSGGAIAAGCHHDSCQEFGWRELREHYEPGAYEYERKGYAGGSENTGEVPEGGWGVLLSEVVPERVRWLWGGRIALGKLNLVDGDPGAGKSAMTTDLAARVTVGKPWPDGAECKAGGVVILSAEDGLADTIRPRFDAAGGDPSRAIAVSTVQDAEGNERQITIPDDLHVIEAAIERVGAVLVVIDPLMAFLPGEVNSHRDQDMRRALAPLARLAERTGAAVVVIRHLNKASGGNALYRGGGSIGIIGAVRSGLLVAKHPEDDGRRVLASIKSNLAAPAPSLVFGLASTESGAVRVDWKGESSLDAAALLAAPTDHEERSTAQAAQEFLRDVLSDGPQAVADIRVQANEAGLYWRTVERAKAALGVRATREGERGKRGGGAWFWSLSTIKVARPEGWRSKPATDRTDGEDVPYISKEQDSGLRPPTPKDNKSANGAGGVNQPLSAGLEPGESATLEELRRIDQLTYEGMSRRLAREEVRGKRSVQP
jgi:AAA domain